MRVKVLVFAFHPPGYVPESDVDLVGLSLAPSQPQRYPLLILFH
jgi:hypothetical protein